MSLKSGRVGVDPACVDPVNGKITIPEEALYDYQKKELSESITIGTTLCTTVEGALSAIADVINNL